MIAYIDLVGDALVAMEISVVVALMIAYILVGGALAVMEILLVLGELLIVVIVLLRNA